MARDLAADFRKRLLNETTERYEMNILIADKFAQSGLDDLRHMGCDVSYTPDLTGDDLEKAVCASKCQVLIVRSTKVPREVIEAAPFLQLVIRAGSGYDTIDVEAATERDVRVCNCPGTNSVAVAELTIGLMIALDRRIVDETDDLRHRVWNKKEYSKALGLKGRTLGVIGLGRIGYEVAKRAAAFDMKLIYTDVINNELAEQQLDIRMVSMDELLRTADFITLHVPGGETNRHMIGARELARMKPAAFLLNCSRGGLVDEEALADALDSGKIAGAAMDVYEIEPAATDKEFKDPIVELPHVYGTHHVGASTEQAQTAVAEEAVKIIRSFRQSGEVLNCVNPAHQAATG